jgi:hypothetical protein
LCRKCGGVAYDGLEIDSGQLSESASAVVEGFNPVHDRETKLLAGCPELLVQDVLRQQIEEVLHRAHPSTGPVLGAATGLIPAYALDATGILFVPPWNPIGITVVDLLLVIACGSWQLATRRKVSARRVAIA